MNRLDQISKEWLPIKDFFLNVFFSKRKKKKGRILEIYVLIEKIPLIWLKILCHQIGGKKQKKKKKKKKKPMLPRL
jgi:hypothetical protein